MSLQLDYGSVKYINEKMPMIGFGTYLITDETELDKSLECALGVGYRLIDTAQVYRNEKIVGKTMKRCQNKFGIKREELFVTSKLHPRDNGKNSYEAVKKSLDSLELDYIDLYLIHWPGKSGLNVTDERNVEARRLAWQGLEQAYKGLVKAIGISNFEPDHIEDLISQCKVVPALNQCEFHPGYCPSNVMTACRKYGIVFQAYSSLGTSDSKSLLTSAKLQHFARKYECSVPQLLLAWALSQGVSVLPKSVNPVHITLNFKAIEIKITPEDIENIKFEESDKLCWDPRSVK